MSGTPEHSLETITVLDIINGDVAQVAENIRSYSSSQVDTWKQLPYLALQAEGKSGYSSFRGKLYEFGLLHIVGDAIGLYGTFIDCDNGNVLRQSGKLELGRVASDAEVVEAWLPEGGKFDAQSWLDQYQKAATEPHKSYMFESEEETMEWRNQTARDLGLFSLFARPSSVN